MIINDTDFDRIKEKAIGVTSILAIINDSKVSCKTSYLFDALHTLQQLAEDVSDTLAEVDFQTTR